LEVSFLSVPTENRINWVYRVFDRRTISIKAMNKEVRKIAAIDLKTNLPFTIEVPTEVSMESLVLEKAYYASLKVYTDREVKDVQQDFIPFFKVVDVDQPIEDFIKAYWLYPKLIRFELVEVEPS
jgi:hypothetical protein